MQIWCTCFEAFDLFGDFWGGKCGRNSGFYGILWCFFMRNHKKSCWDCGTCGRILKKIQICRGFDAIFRMIYLNVHVDFYWELVMGGLMWIWWIYIACIWIWSFPKMLVIPKSSNFVDIFVSEPPWWRLGTMENWESHHSTPGAGRLS